MTEEGSDLPELTEAKLEAETLAQMLELPMEAVIRAGHEALLRLLVAKAKAGTIKHQEMAILRNMLRDNGMMLQIESSKPTLEHQSVAISHRPLPQLPAPDYDE